MFCATDAYTTPAPRCGNPGTLWDTYNLNITCTGFTVGGICTMTCNTGYIPRDTIRTISCGEDLTWSAADSTHLTCTR